MRKYINNKLVNIVDIELFEKGFEGLTLDKKAFNDIVYTVDNEVVNRYIQEYNTIMSSLPFPLYPIESNCKYAFVADYMMHKLDELKADNIIIDKSILIKIDDRALRLVGKSWAIESLAEDFKTKGLDLQEYTNEVEYTQLKWCINRLKSGESIKDYYTEFMKDFVDACGNNPAIINWELQNILTFGEIPEKVEISRNNIVCPSKNYAYMIDIFCTGKKKSNDSVLEIVAGSSNPKMTQKNKLVKVYDFAVYGKMLESTGYVDDADSKKEVVGNKLEKKQLDGMGAVFDTIVGLGINSGTVEKIEYHGILEDGYIFYEINNKLYCCSAETFGETELIAANIELYSYEKGKLYMLNTVQLESGVYRDKIYCYDVKDRKAKLCKTSFRI